MLLPAYPVIQVELHYRICNTIGSNYSRSIIFQQSSRKQAIELNHSPHRKRGLFLHPRRKTFNDSKLCTERLYRNGITLRPKCTRSSTIRFNSKRKYTPRAFTQKTNRRKQKTFMKLICTCQDFLKSLARFYPLTSRAYIIFDVATLYLH